MFSGLVEGTGKVVSFIPHKNGAVLKLKHHLPFVGLKLGDSVAVNGCCLTVTKKTATEFQADLSQETLDVTNLHTLKQGDEVNLERPLCLGDRLGGHLVQGHVDDIGKILHIENLVNSWEMTISFPKKLRKYMIPKGSITVDGISMTLNQLKRDSFKLVIIPHTFQTTHLKSRKVGDLVNLEVDMVGKFIDSIRSYS